MKTRSKKSYELYMTKEATGAEKEPTAALLTATSGMAYTETSRSLWNLALSAKYGHTTDRKRYYALLRAPALGRSGL